MNRIMNSTCPKRAKIEKKTGLWQPCTHYKTNFGLKSGTLLKKLTEEEYNELFDESLKTGKSMNQLASDRSKENLKKWIDNSN